VPVRRWLPWAAIALLAAAPPPVADGAFDATVHPAAPDYARRADWMVWQGGRRDAPVDLFFVQPTTFASDRWNQDIGDATANAHTLASIGAQQIDAFDACCRIYAPRYRQASTRAFGAMAGDGGKAYALAYRDVRAAFLWYLAHDNKGRPFILVGHSQGALHVLHLLQDEIDATPVARRLVAVYAPGIGVPLGDFGTRYRTTVPCDTPTRTGCLASWNSFLPDADTHAYAAKASADYVAHHGDGAGAALLCVNPLTFDMAHPSAEAAANLGGIVTLSADGPPAVPVIGAAGAECRDGVLRVSSSAALKPLPGGSLHFYDIPLFWANLRANAGIRIRAYLRG
jgi:hypothetical protein